MQVAVAWFQVARSDHAVSAIQVVIKAYKQGNVTILAMQLFVK